MKVLAAALAVLLLVAICSPAEADLEDSSDPEAKYPYICCFSHILRPIPRRLIASAYMTSESCPTSSVVLLTKKGRQFCADPKALWVQKYLTDLKILEH